MDTLGELAKFAVSTNASATINLITRDSDILWVGLLSSPVHVGYYKAARTFINVIFVPIDPLIGTTYRELAREAAARQWENVRHLLRTGSLIASIWAVPACLGLTVFGPWFLSWYGPEFGVGLSGDGPAAGRCAGGQRVLLDPHPAARPRACDLPDAHLSDRRPAAGPGDSPARAQGWGRRAWR